VANRDWTQRPSAGIIAAGMAGTEYFHKIISFISKIILNRFVNPICVPDNLPTSTGANVPATLVGEGPAVVWDGTEMIVWGGHDNYNALNSGGRYNPATDSWLPTSTGTNVPQARYYHTAVWDGTEMIVWGGGSNTGGRYNPVTDSWLPTSTGTNVPSSRWSHYAVWDGTEMIVWGGDQGGAVPVLLQIPAAGIIRPRIPGSLPPRARMCHQLERMVRGPTRSGTEPR
jgi:hypothetical protein